MIPILTLFVPPTLITDRGGTYLVKSVLHIWHETKVTYTENERDMWHITSRDTQYGSGMTSTADHALPILCTRH